MSATRYEILGTVATGDFATVYRARDRELGREVAVKQIHQQFLGDPRQLERYWHEAQLLASLQHPHVLTIYDVVRPRGWLILELMQGNLEQSARSGPIDLDYLRVVLSSCLSALGFLHTSGIIHGDVKPSNILVNPQNVVKLGDFGLARRASSEQGSMLKGTTKYMAPELVTNQFGPIGPASDLYSLGFSAYELLCGPQFESLFPALASYGRDRQIAWLMWHAAPDRNLPEIGKVLEGVPPDLAHVIQRLVAKDQTQRYRSAQEVLQELHAPPTAVIPPPRPDERLDSSSAEDARKKRLLRIGAVVAMVCSVALSVAILLPGGKQPPAEVSAGRPPAWGTIRTVYPDDRTLVLESGEDGEPKEIVVKPGDQFYINDKKALLRDLQPGDRAEVEILRNATGGRVTILRATRPEVARGRVESVEVDVGAVSVAIEGQSQPLIVRVPATVTITLNGQDQRDGKPIALADLQPEDRVVVAHVGDEAGRVATEMEVRRVITSEGILRELDSDRRSLKFAASEAADAVVVTMPIAANCEVTINDLRFINEQMLDASDLKPGDRVSVAHDTEIVRVDAYRILGQAGVVQSVQESTQTLQVQLEDDQRPGTFLVGPDTEISLGGEKAELADLRPEDQIDITHDSPDAKNPRALTIAARRPADPNRWAVIIGVQQYDDQSLSPLGHTLADAKLLEDTLVKRYRVPKAQALLLTDPSLVRMEQAVAGLLERVEADDEVVVYFAGHAYRDDEGRVLLAPKTFDFKRMASTGMPLQKLVDGLEQCPAKDKLLLLDASHAGAGEDPARQPSSSEMLQTLNAPPGRAALRTVTAIAGSSPGQRGQVVPDRQHGLFALSLAEAFSGRGDVNRDNRMEPTELYSFVKQSMNSAAKSIGQAQVPQLFLPDARPPRLTEEARAAIRKLAAYLRQDASEMTAVKTDYEAAQQLAGKEIEPGLLYGLLLVKARQRTEAIRHFAQIRLTHPDLPLPSQAIAWLEFDKRSYQEGLAELVDFVKRLPQPKKATDGYPEDVGRNLRWAGQLREFAAGAADEPRRPPEPVLARLDSAVEALGAEAVQRYEEGRALARDVMREFDTKIAESNDNATLSKLRVERRQIGHYAVFPFDSAAQEILRSVE
ncbi:MAG: protein kinase [Rhodopirellula sp.]|nr:protein kinase [Rhodopirellula sp.]